MFDNFSFSLTMVDRTEINCLDKINSFNYYTNNFILIYIYIYVCVSVCVLVVSLFNGISTFMGY